MESGDALPNSSEGMPQSTGSARERVAANIRRLREVRGMTQEDLAAKAKSAQRYISDVEQGLVSVGVDVLENVAAALGTEVADLVGRSTDRGTCIQLTAHELNRLITSLEDVLEVLKAARALAGAPQN
jgi:transcriptional regulator with XRE-family HTH domain